MKRVIIVHGWSGKPDEHWLPWLKQQLEAKGFSVQVPQLPDADTPRIEPWVAKVAQTVGTPDQDTFLVGHSLGNQAIARYLATLKPGVTVGGVVFVAGFFKSLHTQEAPEDQETARLWLTAPLDLAAVESHIKNSVAIFSDDDPDVPPENIGSFRDELGAEIVIEHGKGHFCESDGVTQLPSALTGVLKLAGA
ncbi:MAG: alpha/beta hydrolase [Candidatus Andersenbacteria bacterium]